MDNFEIGMRIKRRRNALGLTLGDMASEIGVAPSTIQRYERGEIGKVKLPILEAIARVLQVNPVWLIGMSDDMAPVQPAPAPEKQPSEVGELSDAQKELIEAVRALPDETCRAVLLVLRGQSPPDAPDGQ